MTQSAIMCPFGALLAVAVLLLTTAARAEDLPIYMDAAQSADARTEDLLARMTFDEKMTLIAGDPATHMDTRPVPRLGIPRLSMADGPHGVRDGEPATSFPVAVCMAATWNEALIERLGAALAVEARAKGRNVLLAPCINLHRTPFGGRNFESFSEDPRLAARMAVGYVKGVQAQGVVAVPKHFAANNQEEYRRTVDVRIDERALRELYFPAFRASVQEAGAWAVMGAYNRLNGEHASQHSWLLTRVLKEEWGFRGLVMSDWLAVHDAVRAGNSGLDLEMPCEQYFGEPLREAIDRGEVPKCAVDDKARRILRVMFLSGVFDRGGDAPRRPARTTAFEDPPDTANPVGSPAHRALALEVAVEGMVLLKNDGDLLPLDLDALSSVAVIGPNAAVARLGGSGCSLIQSVHAVSPLEGIMRKAAGRAEIRHARGCGQDSTEDFLVVPSKYLSPGDGADGQGLLGHYYDNPDMADAPRMTRVDEEIDLVWVYEAPSPELPVDHFSVCWTGALTPPATGEYRIAVVSDDAFALYLDGECLVRNDRGWNRQQVRARSIHLEAGKPYAVRLEYVEKGDFASVKLGWAPPGGPSIEEAVAAAHGADAAVVVVGLNPFFVGEGHDREDLALPGPQAELVKAVCAANANTVVVLNSGTPFLPCHWMDDAPAIIQAFYPGVEGGTALADILFGETSPSGRLPFTWPHRWEDCPAYGNHPGTEQRVEYAEGIFVGYRHFDTADIPVLFPFGHGLTYSRFSYDRLSLHIRAGGDSIDVSFRITNEGERCAAEVAQVYVRDEDASVPRPDRELRAFRKVRLEPGASETVRVTLTHEDLAFYDVDNGVWRTKPGAFTVLVGASSRDIRLTESFEAADGRAWRPGERPRG